MFIAAAIGALKRTGTAPPEPINAALWKDTGLSVTGTRQLTSTARCKQWMISLHDRILALDFLNAWFCTLTRAQDSWCVCFALAYRVG